MKYRLLGAIPLSAAIQLSIVSSLLQAQSPTLTPARIAPDKRADALEYARINSTAFTIRASKEQRVSLLTPSRSYLSAHVDSVVGATLFVRQSMGMPRGAIAAVAIPVMHGQFGTPEFFVSYVFQRPNFGELRGEDIVPRDELERVAVHAKVREFIELGALFEAAPNGSESETRAVHYDDGSGDNRLSISASRHSVIIGDTSVLGRAVVVVRDSTALRLTHAFLRPSRLTAVVGNTREILHGNVVGTRYIDGRSQIVFAMNDTVHLTGTTVQSDGYGGTVESLLVLQSIRQSSMKDSLWRRLIPEQPFDVVRRGPSAPATNPGDTASIVDLAIRDARYNKRTLTTRDVELFGVVLRDARAAFRTGVDRELVALNVIDLLLAQPPSTLRASEFSPCTPDACQLLASHANTAANIPLQAVGLVAAMVTSPQIWTDSVIKYSQSNPFLAERALWLARGVASTAVASAKLPIPLAGSSFDEWIKWYSARNSAYYNWVATDSAMSRAMATMVRRPGRTSMVTVSPQTALAVRFASSRTGVDYANSFRRALSGATSDSARGFYQSMLIAMGEDVYTESELVAIMLSSDTAKRTLALQQLENEFQQPENASEAVAAIVGRHLVNVIFGDSTIDTSVPGQPFRYSGRTSSSADSLTHYVVIDSLPASVRARARELGANVMPRGWQLRPGDAGVVTSMRITQAGAFVRVLISQTTLFSRSTDLSGGFGNGAILTLVSGPRGWTVVASIGLAS